MSIKDEVMNAYKKLTQIEENTQGFLLNPGVDIPLASESFLDGIDLSQCILFMQSGMGRNPSVLEANITNTIYKVMASKRDVGMRNLTRLDYYSYAMEDSSAEVLRLERAKIETVLSLGGNAPGQNKRA